MAARIRPIAVHQIGVVLKGPPYTISIEFGYLRVERKANLEVVLDEQSEMLRAILAACRDADCHKVLLCGPRTSVNLSTMDILELGNEIANTRLQIAVVESHNATADDVAFLENVAWNRGGMIRFFDSEDDARGWLGIT